jgi:hypothetical protein
MTDLSSLEEIIPGFFLTVFRDDAGIITLECKGVLETEDAATKLAPEFLKVHQVLMESKAPLVRLNLKGITYMNSGSIKAFAAWFIKAENKGAPDYVIEAVYDPESTGQRWSLGVLQRIAPNAVKMSPPRRKRE